MLRYAKNSQLLFTISAGCKTEQETVAVVNFVNQNRYV